MLLLAAAVLCASGGLAWTLIPVSPSAPPARIDVPSAARPVVVGSIPDDERERRGPPRPTIRGRTRVLDGDTLATTDQRLRLHGIDAPEGAQRCSMDGRDYGCGARSTAAMHSLVDDEELTCERLDVDRYGRWIARCLRVRDGLDVGGALVRAGWAVAFRHYSSDYIEEENAARAEGAGLWAGRFDEPSAWRRERRNSR